MLRRTLLASAGAMALTGAAVAADLGARPPPPVFLPPPPIFSWTGLYLGVNAGGTWSNSNTVDTTAVPVFAAPTFETELALSSALATTSVPVSNSGFIGGGQIGYNYQFNNSFVAGVEADLQGIAGSTQTGKVFGSGVPVNFPAETITSAVGANKRVDYIGTVRGRLGFLVTPTLLAYGTGGLAYGGVDFERCYFPAESPGRYGLWCAFFFFRQPLQFACRLDGRRRPRMVVLSQLEPQGRISLLRSGQPDVRSQSAN